MKKVLRNIVCGLAAVNLIALAASCSDGLDDDDPFVKSGVVTTSGGNNASGNGDTPADNGGTTKSKYDVSGEEITFPVTVASTNAEKTVLLIKYDRSAAGANELISLKNAELKVYKNGTLVKTFDKVEFALDDYGASFSGAEGQISDTNDMKEYKTKLSIETTVSANDTVKVQLVKGTIDGVGKDAVDYSDIVVALVDIDPSVGYYKELCVNDDEYKSLVKVEETNNSAVEPNNGTGTENQQTTGGNGENGNSGTGTTGTSENQQGNTTTTEETRPAIGETVFTATDADLTIELPVNHYDDADHGIQFAPAGTKYLPKGAKSGEAYKIVMKGTASAEFTADVQFLTAAWAGFGEAINATFTTEAFDVEGVYTFGSDTAEGFMFVIGNSDATLTAKTLTLTEFTITRVEAEASGEVNAEETGGAAANQDATTVTPYSTTNLTVTTVNNAYSTSTHGIQAKVTVRVGDALKGLSKDDTFVVKMKGTASKAFAPQVYFMDNTAAGGYANLGAWGDTVNFTTEEFDISKEVTISEKAPTSDDADAFVFVIDYDESSATEDLENVTFNFSEFSVTKK